MRFSKFAKYLQKLEETSSMLEMTEILANLFRKARSNEVRKVVYLSLGRLAPLYQSVEFGIADKVMTQVLARAFEVERSWVEDLFKAKGDLGLVAEELGSKLKVKSSKLSVAEVYRWLYEIAEESGEGSQERKISKFSELLKSLEPLSSKYVTRIPLGKLRLGFAGKTLIDALSWMKTGDKSLKKEIEKVYFVHPDIGEITEKFKKGGLEALAEIEMEVGVPVQAARCQREKTAEKIMERMGGKAAAEYKLDGTRVQLHMDRSQPATAAGETRPRETSPAGKTFEVGSAETSEVKEAGEVEKLFEKPDFLIKTFTRNLEETTQMFPDIIEAAAKQVKARSCILDGEAIAFDSNTGQFLPFQITVQRKRKYGIKEKAAEVPLKFFVFDVLYLDGRNLLSEPFSRRREILSKVIKEGETIALTPQEIVKNAEGLVALLGKAVAKGLEGLVVKDLDAEYEAGARGYSWIKFKREEKGELTDTIDCVVLGYNAGQGKRADFGIGAFLVGVYNEEEDRFETIAKIGTGLTDEQWREMKERCDAIKISKKPKEVELSKELIPDVWVAPKMVVEILADEITESPVHTAGATEKEPGYALRFPRLVRWRDDKSAQEATAVKEIKKMYRLQFQ